MGPHWSKTQQDIMILKLGVLLDDIKYLMRENSLSHYMVNLFTFLSYMCIFYTGAVQVEFKKDLELDLLFIYYM